MSHTTTDHHFFTGDDPLRVTREDFPSSGFTSLQVDNVTLYFHGPAVAIFDDAVRNGYTPCAPSKNAALVANLRNLAAANWNHLHFAGIINQAIEALS